LRKIAREAIKRKTGARGLRAIIEDLMLDVMYEAPNQKTLKKVIIDKDVVLKQKPPIYVYEKAS